MYLDLYKWGFCAYIPHFGAGIEDFVCINLECILRGSQARKSAFWADFMFLKYHTSGFLCLYHAKTCMVEYDI